MCVRRVHVQQPSIHNINQMYLFVLCVYRKKHQDYSSLASNRCFYYYCLVVINLILDLIKKTCFSKTIPILITNPNRIFLLGLVFHFISNLFC